MLRSSLLALFVLLPAAHHGLAGDWTQWRGNDRNGVASESPALVASLPNEGLKPVWVSEEIGSGSNNGGWGSPVVADFPGDAVASQRVYLFTHKRIKIRDVPKKQYPWLPPEKRVGMTDAEYAEYERKRRDEDEEIARSYVFRETIYCLNAADGSTLWKNENDSFYTRFPQSGSPTISAGRLYILGAGGHVRSIDALTGSDIWNKRLPVEFRDEFWQSSFLIVDDLAILLAGKLFAVSTKDGSIAWEGDSNTTRGTHTSPVLWHKDGHDFVIVNVNGSETGCYEAMTGREVWRIDSQAGLATPVISGDLLITYGNSRKKGVRCFRMSLNDASPVWTYNGCQDKGSSPVVVNNHVFVQGEKRIACVNLETGDEEWRTTIDLGRPQYTSLVAADNKVFYALEGVLAFAAIPDEFTPIINAKVDADGLIASEATLRKLHGIDELEKQDQAAAEKLYQSKIGHQGPVECATPAIADGRFYLRMKNAIACYDLAAASR
jgi:outer membrane protein assembly factor BamB